MELTNRITSDAIYSKSFENCWYFFESIHLKETVAHYVNDQNLYNQPIIVIIEIFRNNSSIYEFSASLMSNMKPTIYLSLMTLWSDCMAWSTPNSNRFFHYVMSGRFHPSELYIFEALSPMSSDWYHHRPKFNSIRYILSNHPICSLNRDYRRRCLQSYTYIINVVFKLS